MSGSLEHSDVRQGVVLYEQKRLTSLVQNLEIVDMTALLKFMRMHSCTTRLAVSDTGRVGHACPSHF